MMVEPAQVAEMVLGGLHPSGLLALGERGLQRSPWQPCKPASATIKRHRTQVGNSSPPCSCGGPLGKRLPVFAAGTSGPLLSAHFGKVFDDFRSGWRKFDRIDKKAPRNKVMLL